VSGTRQLRFPEDVTAGTPVDGDVFLEAGAVMSGAAPAGPVLGDGIRGQVKGEGKENPMQMLYVVHRSCGGDSYQR
jgi:hypothetical protein